MTREDKYYKLYKKYKRKYLRMRGGADDGQIPTPDKDAYYTDCNVLPHPPYKDLKTLKQKKRKYRGLEECGSAPGIYPAVSTALGYHTVPLSDHNDPDHKNRALKQTADSLKDSMKHDFRTNMSFILKPRSDGHLSTFINNCSQSDPGSFKEDKREEIKERLRVDIDANLSMPKFNFKNLNLAKTKQKILTRTRQRSTQQGVLFYGSDNNNDSPIRDDVEKEFPDECFNIWLKDPKDTKIDNIMIIYYDLTNIVTYDTTSEIYIRPKPGDTIAEKMMRSTSRPDGLELTRVWPGLKRTFLEEKGKIVNHLISLVDDTPESLKGNDILGSLKEGLAKHTHPDERRRWLEAAVDIDIEYENKEKKYIPVPIFTSDPLDSLLLTTQGELFFTIKKPNDHS